MDVAKPARYVVKFLTGPDGVSLAHGLVNATNALPFLMFGRRELLVVSAEAKCGLVHWEVALLMEFDPSGGFRGRQAMFDQVIPPDASFVPSEVGQEEAPKKFPYQIFHEAMEEPREVRFIAQRMIGSRQEMSAWLEEAQKLTPCPPGFRWLLEDEQGEHFR